MKENMFNIDVARGIIKDQRGRIMTIKFISRTTGEVKTINCKIGVKKYTKGNGSAQYSFSKKDLISVFKMNYASRIVSKNEAYRAVPLDAVLEVRVNGKTFKPKSDGTLDYFLV